MGRWGDQGYFVFSALVGGLQGRNCVTEEVVGNAQAGEAAAQDGDVIVADCHYSFFKFGVRRGSTSRCL